MHLPPFNYNNKDGDRNSRRSQGSDKSLVKIFLTEPFPLPIWIWNLLVIGIYLSIGLFAIQIVIILVFGNLIPVLLTCPMLTMTTGLPFAPPNQKPPHPAAAPLIPSLFVGFPQGKRILIRTPKLPTKGAHKGRPYRLSFLGVMP